MRYLGVDVGDIDELLKYPHLAYIKRLLENLAGQSNECLSYKYVFIDDNGFQR